MPYCEATAPALANGGARRHIGRVVDARCRGAYN
jgi:hypothetical protein